VTNTNTITVFPGALKNAIDYLYREWNNKAAGFVSHGWRWRRTSGW